jgi:hypothetical protein
LIILAVVEFLRCLGRAFDRAEMILAAVNLW